ncbi:PREDICTED: uncharacterized protein LOC103343275 [Prunus mume]|uniref:Uncharacterized protein LOC103343275 n=1 Tax=Prunus mume TaxID=102107 RepID=A0ABM1LYK6_PRUMU|nr:PREDICTED: uncharacterized protein LOC103343275 [Prunus mume]
MDSFSALSLSLSLSLSHFYSLCFNGRNRLWPLSRHKPGSLRHSSATSCWSIPLSFIPQALGDYQAQLSSSIFDTPISVYKGYSLPKDTEEYLGSCGLTNAIYTIAAADLKDDIFGKFMHCPFQDPASLQGGATVTDALKRRSHEVPASDNLALILQGEEIIPVVPWDEW